MTKDILIEEVDNLGKILNNSKKILLINHRRMDGDAFGSLSGFYYVLKAQNKFEVKAINDELTPKTYNFLNDEEIFEPNLDLKEFNPDLIVSFDAGGIEQLGDVYLNNKELFDKTNFVCIDHHLSNPGFGKLNIINPESSSTCEITYGIIKRLGFEKYIDSKIATFLLTGIITDTNSFFNTNSTACSLKAAGELMTYNPRHQEIIIKLFKTKPFHRLKLWGKVLESLKDIKNGKIVWNTIPKSLFIQTQTTNKDISGLIDEFLTTIDGLDVGFILYELDNGSIKGSFRAKNDKIDLSKFCEKWGGGGHSRASGFVLEGKNLYEVEQEIIQEFNKYYN